MRIIVLLLLSQICLAQCSDLRISVDKFTGEKTARFTQKPGETISIGKHIKSIDTSYYMMLEAYGSTPVVGGKGVSLIYQDGTKEEIKDIEIDCEVQSIQGSYYPYKYTAYIPLSSVEFIKLAKNFIKDYRLYIFDITVRKPEKYKSRAICLLSTK